MPLQVIIILGTLLAFVLLGFMMASSIKKHEVNRKVKGKKGKNKYMPQVKKFGK